MLDDPLVVPLGRTGLRLAPELGLRAGPNDCGSVTTGVLVGEAFRGCLGLDVAVDRRVRERHSAVADGRD